MPNTVCNTPVINPAIIPARNASATATTGGYPARIAITATAPPVAIVPSTVRSAKFKILYVMYTPIDMIPHINPCETSPGSALTRDMGSNAPKTGTKLNIFSSFCAAFTVPKQHLETNLKLIIPQNPYVFQLLMPLYQILRCALPI